MSGSPIILDGLVGALVGSAATIIAVQATIRSSANQASYDRQVELAVTASSASARVFRALHAGTLVTTGAGIEQWTQLESVMTALAAMTRKTDSTFSAGAQDLMEHLVLNMNSASDVGFSTEDATTKEALVALIAVSKLMRAWMSDRAGVAANRYDRDALLVEARVSYDSRLRGSLGN